MLLPSGGRRWRQPRQGFRGLPSPRRARSARPFLFLPLDPLTGDFSGPQGCARGRGAPAFGGAGAAGCAGTRRRPPSSSAGASRPLPGADAACGLPALLTCVRAARTLPATGALGRRAARGKSVHASRLRAGVAQRLGRSFPLAEARRSDDAAVLVRVPKNSIAKCCF